MKLRHLPCFAHALNLVARNPLAYSKDVQTLQEKVKWIVTYFHHSVKASDKLTNGLQTKNYMCLTNEELEIVTKAVTVLQLFEEITRKMSVEK